MKECFDVYEIHTLLNRLPHWLQSLSLDLLRDEERLEQFLQLDEERLLAWIRAYQNRN